MKNDHPGLLLQAEWDEPSAILLAWPHAGTDWAPILREAQQCVTEIARAVAALSLPVIILSPIPAKTRQALGPDNNIHIIEYLTNDTWTRDYGPITVLNFNGQHLLFDFQFNGWGLKFAADRDNLATRALVDAGIFDAPVLNMRSFILEGGSIDTDGKGRLLTTSRCLLSPNRNGSTPRSQIEENLSQWFGTDRRIWLEHGALSGDDTDSHIDTLARFAPGDKILYCSCSDPSHPDFIELHLMEEELKEASAAMGLTLIPLPLPDPILDPDDGSLLPATYANFLALDRAVLVPAYGQPDNDRRAREIIEDAFDRPVIMIDCRVLIRQHGSLHCTTMQIPLKALDLSQINR